MTPFGRLFNLAFFATIIFGLLNIFFQKSFLADDYIYLLKAAQGQLVLSDFGGLVTRIPIPTLFAFGIFKAFTQFPFSVMLFSFFCFALGVLLIAESLGKFGTRRRSDYFVPLIALFIPTSFEIIYWPIAMPYSLGVLCLGWATCTQKPLIRILFLALAMSCYETFVLPALVLLLLTRPFSWKKSVSLWLTAGFLVFLQRKLFALEFPSQPYSIILSIPYLVDQFKKIVQMIFTVHFYKLNFPLTVLEIFGELWILRSLIQTQVFSKRQLLMAVGFLVFSGSHSLVLTYEAPRAFYGSIALKSAFLVYLLRLYWSQTSSLRWIPVVCIAVAFGGGHLLMNQVKDKNTKSLEKYVQAEIAPRMRNCPTHTPCRLVLPDPSQAVTKDWILPGFIRETYVRWVLQTRFPESAVSSLSFTQ